MRKFILLKDFLWGGVVVVYQVEGGWNKDGKGFSICDVLIGGVYGVLCEIIQNVVVGKYYLNYEVVDFYGYYKEDICFFVEMGFKCFCIFIVWMCIFLNGDEFQLNEVGLKFYDDMFDELFKYNIELVIIFFYFEMLLYLVQYYGGWINCKVVDFFVCFVEVVFECYKYKVKYWMIFNEINNQ